MKLILIRIILAIVSLFIVSVGILAIFDTVPPQVRSEEIAIQSSDRSAKCDMGDFEGFPDIVEGPVTLELKNLITVMVKNKDKTVSAEITLPKERCEVQ